MRAGTSIAVAAGFLIAIGVAGPSFATSNYEYQKDEYALIQNGLSPDKKQSLRAHGEGDLGGDNFFIYLFREAPLKRIGPLEELVTLDTAPDAFTAAWAPDSHAVVIGYRSDRHVLEATAYRLADGRAYQITGPSVLEAATKLKAQSIVDDQLVSYTTWMWKSATRFTLKLDQTYRDRQKSLVSRFASFGHLAEAAAPNSPAIVEFSAEADCEIAGNSYRILSLRPGKFSQ